MKCDAVANVNGLCNMEFANNTMKDKVSVVSIKIQVETKKRKGARSKALVDSVGNANVRRKRSENDTVVSKDEDKN